MPKSLQMDELTWTDVKSAIADGFDTVVFGVGATEQHGPHLPLATDRLIGEGLSLAVARKLGNALVAPTVRVGCSDHHMSFPGTLSIERRTLIESVYAYVHSLAKHGFRRVIVIPSHGGNFHAVREVVDTLISELPNVHVSTFADLDRLIAGLHAISVAHGISSAVSGIHAGEFETSLLLHLSPHLVVMSRAEEGYIGEMSAIIPKLMKEGVASVSANGILGDARPADAKRGEAYLEAWVDMILAHAGIGAGHAPDKVQA